MFDHLKLFAVVLLSVVLAACGSNDKADESLENTQEVIEPTVLTQPVDDGDAVEEVENALYDNGLAAGVDTVFYFGYDQATLTPAAQAALAAHATAIRSTNRSIRLLGHTDERGTREYNLALGERRAKAVADYLAIQGVSRALIEVISYGEESPVSFGSDEAAYAANRRVELK